MAYSSSFFFKLDQATLFQDATCEQNREKKNQDRKQIFAMMHWICSILMLMILQNEQKNKTEHTNKMTNDEDQSAKHAEWIENREQ